MRPCVQNGSFYGDFEKTGGEQRSSHTWIWEKVPIYAELSFPSLSLSTFVGSLVSSQV